MSGEAPDEDLLRVEKNKNDEMYDKVVNGNELTIRKSVNVCSTRDIKHNLFCVSVS